ncbi:hypothetical protein L249_2105 [Ophiocordyceps polyrhachis-furcata BCC 54312]|uniref:Uncharacterized protein n=1 Tax=Ophiocordyceps polyrhachis-furcata BCC 54312 TaxID=1330021 RepID=A0A367LRQ9_9HYPO|nr:hypothetical protein L249_2105 [Ophiocordyceps polyrhachis-furcata BCC 54312]
MGMHGPLAAQALGRSPYDDVVRGEGEENVRQPTQQYNNRGHPINPETRRLNRQIVRSHNEVMLVIGVAETDNPTSTAEPDYQARHEAYENSVGAVLNTPAKSSIDAVGLLGFIGLRHRILTYTRYSRIPFWDLFRAARRNSTLSRDIFAGTPTAIVTQYAQSLANHRRLKARDKAVVRRCIHWAWLYIRSHLEYFVVLQRLGLAPNSLFLPKPQFFIPFTQLSPIKASSLPEDLSFPSLLRWIGGALISTAPFMIWAMTRYILHRFHRPIWSLFRLPNTSRFARRSPISSQGLPPIPAPSDPSQSTATPELSRGSSDGMPRPEAPPETDNSRDNGTSPLQDAESHTPDQSNSPAAGRRPSTFSSRADDYASDEDENEGVSTTLISFDVEATDTSDAPPGLWSAELRPSMASDSRTSVVLPILYLDTRLTQIPVWMAYRIFGTSLDRLMVAPFEAIAFRLAARQSRLQQGLSCADIFTTDLTSGLSLTWAVNFFATELLHMALCGEVWAVFTAITQWFHKTDEEWKQKEEEARAQD